MRNRNHPVFRGSDAGEESCIVAMHRANERYHQRLRSERKDEEPEKVSRYQASDEDLDPFFWSARCDGG